MLGCIPSTDSLLHTSAIKGQHTCILYPRLSICLYVWQPLFNFRLVMPRKYCFFRPRPFLSIQFSTSQTLIALPHFTPYHTLSIMCDLICTKSAKNGHGVSSCSNLEGHHRIFTWGEGEELFPIHGRLLAGNHCGRRIDPWTSIDNWVSLSFPYLW